MTSLRTSHSVPHSTPQPSAPLSPVLTTARSAAPHVVALVGFVAAVVSVPVGQYLPFAGHALVLAAVLAACCLDVVRLLRGLVIEIPFVAFALFLPFVASGPGFDVGPLHLSHSGAAAAASMLCKATLATAAALTLTQVTTPAAVLRGLRTLHMPAVLTEIASFMLRYLVVLTDEWRRMSIARAARGAAAHGPRAWLALARGIGSLFVRAFERGERVHLARLSRGYSVGVDALGSEPASARAWMVSVALVGASVLATLSPMLATLVLRG